MSKKIAIFGATGMLGGYVAKHFEKSGYSVSRLSRNELVTDEQALGTTIARAIGKDGIVINCAGVIKPQVEAQGPAETIRVNSLFPHVLANASQKQGFRVIHITTDCVFTGKTGAYTEKSLHDAEDLYGRSKSLGEPVTCTVVRTSIIGEEKNSKRSLIEWAKSQAGKDVSGFTNHRWNGVTCLQFAKIAQRIIENNLYWKGVKHVFSPTSVDKFQLLSMLSEIYALNLRITPKETPEKCFRDLATDFPEHCAGFQIPELAKQIEEMKAFPL